MAPREANNTFADQFLCMDFDGIGLLPNDPVPPAMNLADDGGDEAAAEAAAVVAQQALEQMQHQEEESPSSPQVARPVDPLSIDPTITELDDDDLASPPRPPRLFHLNNAWSSEGSSHSHSHLLNHSSHSHLLNPILDYSQRPPQIVPRLVSQLPEHWLDITQDMSIEDDPQHDDASSHAGTAVSILSDGSPMSARAAASAMRSTTQVSMSPVMSLASMNTQNTHTHTSTTHDGTTSTSTPPQELPSVFHFGPNTTLVDLKYFAERGCIVALLNALNTPKLTAQGSRLLADYAKNPSRRVAVASNRKILEFTLKTMHGYIGNELPLYTASDDDRTCRERSVEYAVETIRSLTATEESDAPLMQTPGLLLALAMLARGGRIGLPTNTTTTTSPRRVSDLEAFATPATYVRNISRSLSNSSSSTDDNADNVAGPDIDNIAGHNVVHNAVHSHTSQPSPVSVSVMERSTPLTSLTKPHADCQSPIINSKSRLHACIAIMNLSCGKSNKLQIAQLPQVLLAMRDVMIDNEIDQDHLKALTTSSNAAHHLQESRLKATTCIKNLSNADANDSNLLHTPGLVEALGHVILISLAQLQDSNSDEPTSKRATLTVTNACLALMNLSIAKANKHRVFQSVGVMEALMAVITSEYAGSEARIKSCSALSNLAIGYDNKIPMFYYNGFVEAILQLIETDRGEARTKACSILWSFAAEMRNQVPVVQRGDILPTLVKVAEEDDSTEARFKCVAALTLLAESLENAMPLLESGALHPLMDILAEAGPDPTQWQGQTASWCVGFLMNIAQSDDAVPSLRNAGVVELLAPLLTLDHYQSLKAAMAVTFVCRYDEDDSTYDLLRKTESVIPKIIALLHNTLAGKGGNGYKYGVFTLRSSVGCVASLASGPVFMKERMATGPVYDSLLRVLSDFCVDCTPGAIVGGGRDDSISATLAVQALRDLTSYLIPAPGAPFPFGPLMEERLITALSSFERSTHPKIKSVTKQSAQETRMLLMGIPKHNDADEELLLNMAMAPANFCCDFNRLCSPSPVQPYQHPAHSVAPTSNEQVPPPIVPSADPVRTFLLSDCTGRRFAVPIDATGGRRFNDQRLWCYRRGRFCLEGESPDANFVWTIELENAYQAALQRQEAQRKMDAKKAARSRSLFC